VSALDVPAPVADWRQLSPQPVERGRGRGRPGWGSAAVGRAGAGTRQLRAAHLAAMAGPRVRRSATQRGRSLRRTSAAAPPLRVAGGDAASRSPERGTLSHPARRLRRSGRSPSRPPPVPPVFPLTPPPPPSDPLRPP